MKKIFIFLSVSLVNTLAIAQVRNNESPSNAAINNTTAFLDASSSPKWNGSNNNGKGLVFPRTDLTTMTTLVAPLAGRPNSFPTQLDGMIVYNTGTGETKTGAQKVKVTPGFYFYENKSTTLNGGTWKPLEGSKWTNDSANNRVKLTTLSDGSTAREDAKNLFVGDDGNLTVGAMKDATATTDRMVVADKEGKLKATIIPVKMQAATECKEETIGTINYGEFDKDGKQVSAFGFCMKRDNVFQWFYMYGGVGVTTGNATFGTF